MESTGSTFPKWQLAILLGTPVAIGLGYLYWRDQQATIEEGADESDETKRELKKLKKGVKSISIDGDNSVTSNGVKKTAKGTVKELKLSPFDQAVKHKESGNDCFKKGKYDGAIEFYDQAIDICPKDKTTDLSQFHQNRAAAYEQLGKWEAVADDCTKALELNQKYIKALHRRARAYDNMKQLELCLEDVTAVAILEGIKRDLFIDTLHSHILSLSLILLNLRTLAKVKIIEF